MLKVTKIVMPIPHGSNNLTEKNHNEILHLLCMPHDMDKLWHIIKKMTYKNLNIVKKTSQSVQYLNYRCLTTKTCLKHRGVVFGDVKR